MMIQSMTGFSRTTQRGPSGSVTVELRSTNHRYLEIDQRLPNGLPGLEGEVAQLIKGRIRRGRIDVNVSIQPSARASVRRVVVDEALTQAYYEQLLGIKQRFGLKGPVTLDQLLAFPSVFSVRDDSQQRTMWLAPIRQAVEVAVRQLVSVRQREGRRLISDVRAQIALIRRRLAAVRVRLPRSLRHQARRLHERLKALLGASPSVTRGQIQEALALVKDVDIHEELVRLESHMTHAQQVLAGQQAVGKTLDFIAQELMREANTMGAKANDASLGRHIIEIKGAIEKIREQAQNLE